jgi:hypothetical protein
VRCRVPCVTVPRERSSTWSTWELDRKPWEECFSDFDVLHAERDRLLYVTVIHNEVVMFVDAVVLGRLHTSINQQGNPLLSQLSCVDPRQIPGFSCSYTRS